jgi:prepilin-type N-terminal cleavage/methylation domain-containing protein
MIQTNAPIPTLLFGSFVIGHWNLIRHSNFKNSPHPNLLPEYQERGEDDRGPIPQTLMNSRNPFVRKAFTLAELLVVIGIIAILAALLIPGITIAYRSSQRNAQLSDFHAITSALEAYRQDFGDYPRNQLLPSWNPASLAPPSNPPYYLSLATALLGPGPGATQLINGQIHAGDGLDGPGFRIRASRIPVQISSVTANSVTLASGITLTSFTDGLTSLAIEPGTPKGETIGIAGPVVLNSLITGFNLKLPAQTHTPDPVTGYIAGVILTPTGTPTQAYLPPEKFNVQWIPDPNPSNPWQPVMLDRWGTPIQYFPRYGALGNRTGDTNPAKFLTHPDLTVVAGPLYGKCTPFSIDASTLPLYPGDNAFFDYRDAAIDPADPIAWDPNQQPDKTNSWVTDYTMALRWMLGDESAGRGKYPQDNVIRDTGPASPPIHETLHFDGPFILISAGPSGKFCNLWNNNPNLALDRSGTPVPANQPFPQSMFPAQFKASANIYNFDR